MAGSSSFRAFGMRRRIGFTTISSAPHPKDRSAPLFQLVTIPFRSFVTMASSDESIMADKKCSALSNPGGSLLEEVIVSYAADNHGIALSNRFGRPFGAERTRSEEPSFSGEAKSGLKRL